MTRKKVAAVATFRIMEVEREKFVNALRDTGASFHCTDVDDMIKVEVFEGLSHLYEEFPGYRLIKLLGPKGVMYVKSFKDRDELLSME